MKIKDYVNWFYKNKIENKNPTFIDWNNYMNLSVFYLWTMWFELEKDIKPESETITVINKNDKTKITLILNSWEALVIRNNKTELVSNIQELVYCLYWIQ